MLGVSNPECPVSKALVAGAKSEVKCPWQRGHSVFSVQSGPALSI